MIESGPLFITYTTLAKHGDYNAYCNITYRFFRWGWICETNSTFNSSASGQVYRNNEWVFNPGIMRNLTYRYQYGTPTTVTFGETSRQENLYSNVLWFCLWDQGDREAVGTFDLVSPQVSGATVRQGYWYYRVFWYVTSYYEFWDRYWGIVDFSAGGWIYEKFAVYIWDGSRGYAPFQAFAEGMKASLTVSVGTPEDVFYKLEVTVTDPSGAPIPGANVSIFNDEDYTQLNVSKLTDENGKCTFFLYYCEGGYYLQANLSLPYLPPGDQYVNRTGRWTPGVNSSSVTIVLNATRLYIEVYDKLGSRVQNANVTINYTSGFPQNIVNQSVDPYYANICLYVKVGASFYVNISTQAYPNEQIKLYNMSDGSVLSQPLTLNGPANIRVELDRTLYLRQTQLRCEGGSFFTVYWSDEVNFSVWIERIGPNVGINASWVNYTISHLNGTVVVPQTVMTENTSAIGQWYVTLNTTGLVGGYIYLVTFYGEPLDTDSYAYPVPVTVYLVVKELPVTVGYESFINVTWSSPPSFNISVYLNDTRRNMPVENAVVSYSILGTPYSGIMNNVGGGYYAVPVDVLSNLTSGVYTIEVAPIAQNYSINPVKITLVINPVPTSARFSSELLHDGYVLVIYNRTLTFSVELRDVGGNPVTGATVVWFIGGTEYSGNMVEKDSGVYVAALNLSELSLGSPEPGLYVLHVIASKQNYQFQEITLSLSISGIPVTFTPITLPLSSKFIVGQYIMAESNVPFVPLIFTLKDDLGRPVTGANITLLSLPVWEVSPGVYLTLIPVSGLSDVAFPLSVKAEKAYYQSASTVILLNVKEWSVPLVNLPYKFFLALLASILLPSSAFAFHVYLQRARIPPIIRRIDYLIDRIYKGLPVEVGKPKTRESVITAILAEELSLIGVEPKPPTYVTPEVMDKLVPLLVEIGKSESEARVILAELRAASPTDREKLLETLGVPPDISAAILQELEKEEERTLSKKEVKEEEAEKEETGGEEQKEEAAKIDEGGEVRAEEKKEEDT
ncbi:MAG: carboxypeptidase-like regulatory domain-containing protein [Candidatus Jordarchaeales archaeon]